MPITGDWLCVFSVGFSAEAIARFVTEKTAMQVIRQIFAINFTL